MVQILKVWECIGCGRIDGPQPCVGVCRDRKAELVYASDYSRAQDRNEALEQLVRRIAYTAPFDGRFEDAWRALQEEARALL